MGLYTLEICSLPVLVLGAKNLEEANDLVRSPAIADELQILEHDGAVLWGGNEDQLFVRDAHPEEVARWEVSFAQAKLAGDANDEDLENWLTFLVPVSDPTDDWESGEDGEGDESGKAV